MAAKSKGFKELLVKKQNLSSLARGLVNRVTHAEGGADELLQVPGQLFGLPNMSDILKDFVEPEMALTKNHAEVKSLMRIAVIAWNLALMPQAEFEQALAKILAIEPDLSAQQDMIGFLQLLVERKKSILLGKSATS
jgi:hypothetical protein